MTLYKTITTYQGADGPSYSYFDTEERAQNFISSLDNGEVVKVEITADYKLNYSDGCTFNDLTFGEFDATEEVLYG